MYLDKSNAKFSLARTFRFTLLPLGASSNLQAPKIDSPALIILVSKSSLSSSPFI